MRQTPDIPWYRRWRTYQEVTGKRVISGMTAGCDARHLTNILKIPTVVYGPGSCHFAHKVNEFLPKDQFLMAIETYAKMIMKWTC